MSGASENVTARKPRAALRRISSAAISWIAEVRDLVRDEAPGCRAAPGVEVPVVVRAHRDEREFVVVGPHRQALAHESREERREAQRRGDAVDVHVVDALVARPRRLVRISSKRVGSNPYSVDGRPTTALNPTFGKHLSLPDPRFATVVGRNDARFVVGVLLREAPAERVGRFDDVVVDGDHGVRAFARFGLRQPGDRFPPALAAAEVLVARKVVEREAGHMSTSGSVRSSWRTAPSQ